MKPVTSLIPVSPDDFSISAFRLDTPTAFRFQFVKGPIARPSLTVTKEHKLVAIHIISLSLSAMLLMTMFITTTNFLSHPLYYNPIIHARYPNTA